MKRLLWKTNMPLSPDSGKITDDEIRYEVADEEEATLVGSMTGSYSMNGPLHAPTIDIDHPCRLVESSTPGHFHLYIDVEMEWDKYVAILQALTDAGVVEPGYLGASVRKGQTFVRKPGLKK